MYLPCWSTHEQDTEPECPLTSGGAVPGWFPPPLSYTLGDLKPTEDCATGINEVYQSADSSSAQMFIPAATFLGVNIQRGWRDSLSYLCVTLSFTQHPLKSW